MDEWYKWAMERLQDRTTPRDERTRLKMRLHGYNYGTGLHKMTNTTQLHTYQVMQFAERWWVYRITSLDRVARTGTFELEAGPFLVKFSADNWIRVRQESKN